MPLQPRRSNAAANAAVDAMAALCNSGTIQIRSGTQPATANDAATGTLLAELTFGNPAFAAGVNGVATANAITQDSSADNTGTATWFRVRTSGAATVWDGSVGTATSDLVLNSTAIQAGAAVSITSLTLTEALQ